MERCPFNWEGGSSGEQRRNSFAVPKVVVSIKMTMTMIKNKILI